MEWAETVRTILSLLLTVWTRGRKKEIGILLSLGKSKANVIFQIFAETVTVAVISFAAAIPLGGITAAGAEAFLASTASDLTAAINVHIDTLYLLPLILGGILLISISVIASSLTIVRLNPKDIITKMS